MFVSRHQKVARRTQTRHGLPNASPVILVKSVVFDTKDAHLDAILKHRTEYRILRSFDVKFQQVNVAVPEFLNNGGQPFAGRIEEPFSFLKVQSGIGDMGGVFRSEEPYDLVTLPKSVLKEVELFNPGRLFLNVKPRPRCGIEGENVAAERVNQAEVERDVFSHPCTIADRVPA